MIKVKNLKFAYDKQNRFEFNLTCQKGEIIAIVGKSGAGKSTLFDLIAGFLTPSFGKIEIDNKEIQNLPIQKRPLTILFQKHNLFEHLSVEKNIALGNPNATKDEIKEILKEVGLDGYSTKLSTTLSGGQQQRVALARALIRKKPILLLDEPFTGLDSQTKDDMLKLVLKITKQHQLHTIMITHDKDDTKVASQTFTMQNDNLI